MTSANGDRQGVRLNENEMWIDTLFMTVLFLNEMGQKYGREEWVNEGIHQMLMHIKYLYDKKTGLFYHGWTFNGNHNFGGVFWCRGNSWFTLGSMEYIEMSRGNLNPGVKTLVIDTYKAQAAPTASGLPSRRLMPWQGRKSRLTAGGRSTWTRRWRFMRQKGFRQKGISAT